MRPGEAGDRLEIEQVIHRYFLSMDTWDYDLLDRVFTEDAVVHYEALQGLKTSYREMLPHFREFNRHFCFMQHVGGQLLVELEGDRARARCNLRAIHVQKARDGSENRWVIYGAYRDELVRTGEGWRIAERRFRQMHSEGELLPFDQVESYDEPPWL